jgi:hypothetical protein
MEATTSIRRSVPLKGWWDELLVVALVIVALLLGWAFKGWVLGQMVTFTSDDGAVSLSYPDRWLEQVDKETLVTASDVRGEGPFKPTFSLRMREMDPEFPLTENDLLASLSLDRGGELTAYRVLSVDQGELGGLEASKVTYAYVAEPASGSQSSMPVVVQAIDWVVFHEGRAYILSFAAAADRFADEEGAFNSILASVDLS